MAGGAVEFTVPAEVAYDYLVEPTNRPQWQSSLRTVVVPDAWEPGAEARVGLRWVDVTWPGLCPRMELTLARPGQAWGEHGFWGPFTADLTLRFSSTPDGCRVWADFEVRASGVLAPLGRVLTALGQGPVLADLRRAARLLEERDAA